MSTFQVSPRLVTLRHATIAGAGVVLLHLALTLLYRNNLPVRIALSDVILLIMNGLAAASLYYAAVRSAHSEPQERTAWMMLALSQAGRTISALGVALGEIYFQQKSPMLLINGLDLAADFFFVIGLLLFADSFRRPFERARTVLDLGIWMVAALLLAWVLVLTPRMASNQTGMLQLSIALGFVAEYVVMLFVLFELLLGRRAKLSGGVLFLLSCGAVAKIVAGMVAAGLCRPAGACLSGDLDDVAWLVSFTFIALAGLRQITSRPERAVRPPQETEPRRGQPAWSLYSPYFWLAAAYVLLVTNHDDSQPVTNAVLAVGTGAIIFFVIIRQALVLNDNMWLFANSSSQVLALTRAETEIRQLNQDLERRVLERTSGLERANRDLETEIAERRRAEAALGASEAELRALFAAMTDVVLIYDAHGRYLQIAPTNPALMFKPPAEMVGRTVHEVLPTPVADYILRQIQLALQEHQPVAIEYSLPIGGALVWFEGTASQIEEEKVFWIVRDITERKRAEEVQARLAAIVESSDDAVIGKTLDGIITTWNAGAEMIYGYSAEEIMGQSISILVPPHRADESEAILEGLKRGEHFRHLETARIRKDGQAIQVSLTISPIRDGAGRITGASTIARDITERKRMEAELQSSNEKLQLWVEQLEQGSREIALLSQLGDLLQSSRNAEEAYQVIARSGRLLFPADSGALFVLRNSRNLVEMTAFWGESPPRVGNFTPDDCWALRRGRLHVVEEQNSDLVCPHLVDDLPANYMCIPMMAQGETVGVLHLRSGLSDPNSTANGSHAPGEHFATSKQQLASTVAEQIALSLSGLKLREVLRQQALRDPLTGLFNRRYMEETIERELHRAARNSAPVGIIMLDIDHFKEFNDNFGHAAGDAVLRELGAVLQEQIRREDIACRYGGDEFVIVLPECSVEKSRERAEQLHEEFKDIIVKYLNESLPAGTLSVGVAGFPVHGSTAESLLRKADQALYCAKAGGRSQVVVAK